MSNNSTTRFSNRVNDYVKYRPGYPSQLIPFLEERYNLNNTQLIADIGAGTGISTELFLKAGYKVTAVEPNKKMLDKAVELLSSFPGFTPKASTAEQTELDAHSVDVIIAGQAFHWFDAGKTKVEFKRILKPGGLTVLIWNERKTSSGFEKDYDALIVKHARDYVQVDHRNIDTKHIEEFFSPEPVHLEVFANKQVFNFEGLKGRLLSSSYMPAANEEGYDAMVNDLKILFDNYQSNEHITINYDTKVYAGEL